MLSFKRYRVELVGGPYCGRWVLVRGYLPDDRTIWVTPGMLDDLSPLFSRIGACEYFLETDEADDEQRACFVREVLEVAS